MTRDGVVTMILSRLRRVGDSTLAASIISEMNLFQQMGAEGGPLGQLWFLLRYGELTLSVDRRQAALPEDFSSFPQEEGCIFLPAAVTGDPDAMIASTRFLPGMTFTGQFDTASGAGWSQQGLTINFARQLNVGDTPIAIYYGREPLNETAFGAGSQPAPNAWMVNAPDWFIAKMCWLFGTTYLKYADAEERFGKLVAEAEARLIAQNTMMEEGSRVRVMNEFYQRTRSGRGGFTET